MVEFGNIEHLIEDKKEVKIAKDMYKKYNIHPALSDDIDFSIMLLFMEKMKKDKKFKEKIQILKDLQIIKTLHVIQKTLEGSQKLEMIKETNNENDISFKELLKELLK